MGQKFIFFRQKDLCLLPSLIPAPIVLLPSNLAIQAQCPSNLNPLEYGYTSKILDCNLNYLSFDFSLSSNTACFFVPTSILPNCTFALLDLHLPPLLGIECALFVYEKEALFCFYQEGKLAYLKQIENPSSLSHCLLLVSKLYSIPNPSFTLFDYGFTHSFCATSTLTLTSQTLTLNSSPPLIALEKKSSNLISLGKFFALSSLLTALSYALLIFFSPPPSPPAPTSPHSKNLNASYPLYSLLSLLTPSLVNEDFLSYQYTQEEGLTLSFAKPFSPKLLQLLHSKGYKTNVLDPMTLRIGL